MRLKYPRQVPQKETTAATAANTSIAVADLVATIIPSGMPAASASNDTRPGNAGAAGIMMPRPADSGSENLALLGHFLAQPQDDKIAEAAAPAVDFGKQLIQQQRLRLRILLAYR